MPTGNLVQLCVKRGDIGMVDVVETGLKTFLGCRDEP